MVIENYAIEAGEDVVELEVELRKSFEAAAEVGAEVGFATDLAVRQSEETRGNGRGEFHGVVVVSEDGFEVVSIPGGNPVVGKVPSVFGGHSSLL